MEEERSKVKFTHNPLNIGVHWQGPWFLSEEEATAGLHDDGAPAGDAARGRASGAAGADKARGCSEEEQAREHVSDESVACVKVFRALELLALVNPANDILQPLAPRPPALEDAGSIWGVEVQGKGDGACVSSDGSWARKPPGRVVIVGGGFAGVSAARRLIGWGYQVLVLEAQNRSGGRVWSQPLPSPPLVKGGDGAEGWGRSAEAGMCERGVVDLGGMVVTGTQGNPLVTIARAYKIALRP